MPLRVNGSTSGYTELSAPATAGNNTVTLPTGNGSANQVLRNSATPGTLEFGGAIVSGTAQNSTSGTAIDFTSIPSWVKRVTVMLAGISTNGTSHLLVQIGTGGMPTTSGYVSTSNNYNATNATNGVSSTAGFAVMQSASASAVTSGHAMLTNVSGNLWIASHAVKNSTVQVVTGGGDVTLAGVLNMVRITTGNGTDAFDAGSINILYE